MIASAGPRPYIAGMAMRWIAPLLTLFALIVAPLSLLTGTASAMPMLVEVSAASHHATAGNEAAHCAEMTGDLQPEKQDTGRSDDDCRVKCAVSCSAVPILDDVGVELLVTPLRLLSPRLISSMTGLAPEATDPPPRTA